MRKNNDIERLQAKANRESLSNKDNTVTDETIQTIAAWIYKHTKFRGKETVQNIVSYCIEFAWEDWDPVRGVPFTMFIWRKKGTTYLYLQKAISRQLKEHGEIEKKWYKEIPGTWSDKNGNEHCIEEFADRNDLETQLFREERSENYCDLIDPTEFALWIVNEINAYIKYLTGICDFNKLHIMYALCTKNMRLRDIAESKGLSHENMSPLVTRVCDDLAYRTGIPRSRIRKALSVIKGEITFSSQLTIQLKEILNAR